MYGSCNVLGDSPETLFSLFVYFVGKKRVRSYHLGTSSRYPGSEALAGMMGLRPRTPDWNGLIPVTCSYMLVYQDLIAIWIGNDKAGWPSA